MRLDRGRLAVLFDRFGFVPTDAQRAPFDYMLDGGRRVLVAGGERAGKSATAGMWGAASVVMSLDPGLYWVVGAEYEDGKPEFDYIMQGLDRVGALDGRPSIPRNGPRSLTTYAGVTVETKSAHDPTKLGRVAPDGILMCEAGRHSYESYLRLLGRCAEKRAWLWISGTFESSVGWYPQLFKAWQVEGMDGRSFSIPSWTNTAIYPGGRQDPEILQLERQFPLDKFSERFGGVPVPPMGLVFREVEYGTHIKRTPYIPGHPVQVWIDPGYSGAYAVEAVQIVGGYVNVVGEVYRQALTDSEIIQLCTTREWWKDVAGGVIDQAAKQHTTRSQQTTWDTWREEAGIVLGYKPVSIQDGISRTRMALRIDPIDKKARLSIDPQCKGLIAEMSGDGALLAGLVSDDLTNYDGYRYKTADGALASETPIDRNNHACKALAYGLVHQFGTVTRKRKRAKQYINPGRIITQQYFTRWTGGRR